MKRLVLTNTNKNLVLEVQNVILELDKYRKPPLIDAIEMADGDNKLDDDN